MHAFPVPQDLAERKMAQLLQYVLERDGDVGVTALEVRTSLSSHTGSHSGLTSGMCHALAFQIVVDLMMTHGLGPFMAIHVEVRSPFMFP